VTAINEKLSDGTINQSGGTHNIAGGGSAGSGVLVHGFGFGATSTYNLSGGNLNVTNDDAAITGEIVGNFGGANFVHTGGSHSVNGNNGSLVIGAGQTSTGTYSLSNNAVLDCGSLDVARDSGATGTLTVASGSTGA
jgi:hypothetical protein